MSYQTDYGLQGVDGIMVDFGIDSFSDFNSEDDIREFFTMANVTMMFGETDLTKEKLDAIADEFIDEWDSAQEIPYHD